MFVDSDDKLCSACVALCRTYGCKKKLADGDATLCSDCRLNRDLIPNETDPNDSNVLCGRGKRINGHTGNVQFRKIIQSTKSEYLAQKEYN